MKGWQEESTASAEAQEQEAQERSLYCIACKKWATWEHRIAKKHILKIESLAQGVAKPSKEVEEELRKQEARRGGAAEEIHRHR